jgi:hypothetical protein
MKAFAAGVVVALVLGIGSVIAYNAYGISAQEYFSTDAARL